MRPSKNERMRLLVTGCSGPYGAHFARLCLDRGYDVFSIRRTDKPNDAAALLGIAERITWAYGDVRDTAFLLHCLAAWNVQAVAHFAALPIVSTAPSMLQAVWSVNAAGTVALLDAIRQYRPETLTLFVSTDKALGHVGDRPYTEDMAPKPEAPYDASKYAAEVACRSYQTMGYTKHLVITRSCNIVATADTNWRLVPNSIRQCLTGVPMKVYTKSQWSREFIAVEDAVEAQLMCLLRADETPGETFHLGSGVQLTQEEVIAYIKEHHFPDAHIIRVEPPAFSRIEIPYQMLDSTKIRERHGWKLRLTAYEAIDRVADWWKERPHLAPWSRL